MAKKKLRLTWSQARRWLLWFGLPLAIGILIAAALPRPVIGVIRLNDAIYSFTARDLISQIEYARTHSRVRAVVLVLDTPGGTVVDTESVYLELSRLRAQKPVVTSINGMAASGGYYLSVGTDYIFAKPTSDVGNIGVIGYLPPVPRVYEEILSTGPYKLWGMPRDEFMRQIDLIKQAFYRAVQLGRGDRLQVGPEVVLTGQIWPGSEALRLGLIDAIGPESQAIEYAAQLAGLRHYRVLELDEVAGIEPEIYYYFFYRDPQGVTLPYPAEPGLYLLYVPSLPLKP